VRDVAHPHHFDVYARLHTGLASDQRGSPPGCFSHPACSWTGRGTHDRRLCVLLCHQPAPALPCCETENLSTSYTCSILYEKQRFVKRLGIVAIPDEKWGERPKAFVTLKPDHSATEAEIIAFCRQYLAHFKCPASVEFGGLPKNSTGEVQKFVLRGKEWGSTTNLCISPSALVRWTACLPCSPTWESTAFRVPRSRAPPTS
jgi:hypothetical protein